MCWGKGQRINRHMKNIGTHYSWWDEQLDSFQEFKVLNYFSSFSRIVPWPCPLPEEVGRGSLHASLSISYPLFIVWLCEQGGGKATCSPRGLWCKQESIFGWPYTSSMRGQPWEGFPHRPLTILHQFPEHFEQQSTVSAGRERPAAEHPLGRRCQYSPIVLDAQITTQPKELWGKSHQAARIQNTSISNEIRWVILREEFCTCSEQLLVGRDINPRTTSVGLEEASGKQASLQAWQPFLSTMETTPLVVHLALKVQE